MTPASRSDARVRALLAEYHEPQVTAPWLFCDRHPGDAVAFRFVDDDLDGHELTYADLASASRRAARALADHGVGPGDRVATLMGKGPDLVAVILGIWRLGAVYVPVFTAFAAEAVAERLAAAGVRAVVTDGTQLAKVTGLPHRVLLADVTARGCGEHFDLSAALRDGPSFDGDPPTRGPGTPIVQMATSGTTGKPKVVVHPLAYAASWQSYLEHGLAPGATFWCAADPGWAYGLYTALLAPMAAGVPSLVTRAAFAPARTWDVLERFAVTDLAAAPTALRALHAADDGRPLPNLARISTAGEPLTPDIGNWTRRRFGLDVRDHFGQTELGMPAGFAQHPDLAVPVVPRAMGLAFPGWSVTVLDAVDDTPVTDGRVGRLAVDVAASPFFTFTGYGAARDQRASRFTPSGAHYLTGDLASIEDGLIRFSARDDDVILMAGYRIGPFDVESVLATHPRVRECAVVAAPDPMRGEVVHAFVVPEGPPAEPAALERELQDWVRERYAAHAYPRAITFVEALPKTPSGKVQRVALRRTLAAAADGPSDD